MIACRALGPVELTVDGRPAPAELLWRKNLALLVYLARSPRRTRTREHLIGLVWADRPETRARQSLREAIRLLRRHLGEAAVDATGDQVRLAADALALDVGAVAAGGDAAAGRWRNRARIGAPARTGRPAAVRTTISRGLRTAAITLSAQNSRPTPFKTSTRAWESSTSWAGVSS